MADTFSLRNIYLFAHLSDARLSQIAPVLERRTLKKGDVVFNRGDAGDALYLVEQGQLAIFAPDPANPGEEKPIRLFHKEDALGEMALIDHQPRSLSARAEQDSVVLVLKDSDFRRFVSEDADLAFAVIGGPRGPVPISRLPGLGAFPPLPGICPTRPDPPSRPRGGGG